MLSKEQKKDITDILNKRKDGLACPMCQNKNFIMADGYFINSIQTDLGAYNLGGSSIPTIGIICRNCGFVSQHALGVLDLLPKKENNKNDEPNK